jgi:cation transport ATPase
VSLDYLVSADHEKSAPITDEERKLKEATQKVLIKNRKAITGIGIQMVWLVAIIVFIPIALFVQAENAKWLPFLYAIPVSSIVWLVFNTVWFNKRRNYLIISILMWSILAAVHLNVLMFGGQLHYIYLLGLPGQLIIILWSVISKKPSKS